LKGVVVLSSHAIQGAVIALAGRRIDPEPAEQPRFPFDCVVSVREAIAQRLRSERAHALVCSAACGADLLALEAAGELGIRTRIVLPFRADWFRRSSVVDRPRPEFWGSLFDRVSSRARETDDLVELNCAEDDNRAYSAANRAIIDEAMGLADGAHQRSTPISRVGMVVWEGAARGSGDATQEFADLARAAGFRIEEVRSLGHDVPRSPP
jgi:hypothetical protein